MLGERLAHGWWAFGEELSGPGPADPSGQSA
jgi:hypothetical protein